MTATDELLKARFGLTFGRVNGLIDLLYSNEALKPTGFLRSEGARADILRSIVVFLHATFEVVLRSHVPKPNKKLSFYSRTDIDKALKLSGIDAKPFKPLYKPLTQMAKRRKRIVHDADLSTHTAAVCEPWTVVDDWQLILWWLAVRAFYYQLRMSVNTASAIDRMMHERLRQAMLGHQDTGKELLAFPKVPQALQRIALQKIVDCLESTAATLKLDVSHFVLNER